MPRRCGDTPVGKAVRAGGSTRAMTMLERDSGAGRAAGASGGATGVQCERPEDHRLWPGEADGDGPFVEDVDSCRTKGGGVMVGVTEGGNVAAPPSPNRSESGGTRADREWARTRVEKKHKLRTALCVCACV